MTFTCRGIILKIENFRESDYLLDFYSEEHGKLEIIVQGARKIKSKLVGLCQPFVLLNLVIASGKRNHLIGGKGIKYFRNIWTNYQKIKYAKNILDLANDLIKKQKPDKRIFSLILKIIDEINKIDGEKAKISLEILTSAFTIKLLSYLGYKPEIKNCLFCSQNLTRLNCNFFYFSLDRGGIVCCRCYRKEEFSLRISRQVLKILQDLLYQKFDFLIKQNYIWQDFLVAKNIINEFLEWRR